VDVDRVSVILATRADRNLLSIGQLFVAVPEFTSFFMNEGFLVASREVVDPVKFFLVEPAIIESIDLYVVQYGSNLFIDLLVLLVNLPLGQEFKQS
jgi:hypothetical protein